MAVKRKQYGEELEKNIAEYKTLSEAHKKAVEKSQVKVKKKSKKEKEYDEEGLVKRTKRRLRELYYGKKTYMPKKKKTKKNVLKKYAEETGKPKFTGAHGADLAELQKRFGGKK